MQDFYIYILLCSDGSYYTGHTDDMESRMSAHQQRFFPHCYTAKRLPVQLVFVQATSSRAEALIAERQIKGWTRRKKKALIDGDFELLKKLAKKTNFRKR
jgi:predicted GIY-YIG superfamily endonuclease